MMVDWGTVTTSLLASAGGGAAIAYAIFRGLGTKWIDSHFARQLEKSRQDHATQTEHLRFRIAGLLDRSTKLNQREFEVLPGIWQNAHAAYGAASYLLDPWRSEPDFIRMAEAQFEELMDDLDIAAFQKAKIKAASPHDRNALYREAMRWRDLIRAQSAARDFSNALSSGSIYLHPDTYQCLKDFEKRLVHGILDRKVDMQHPRQPGDPVCEDDSDAFRKNGQTWFTELGDFLRNRYWQTGVTEILGDDPTK